MKLVTIANKPGGYFEYFIASCERFGAQVTVLGWGQPWNGFNQKNIMVAHFLQDQHDDEIICVVDAYDVILLRSLHDMEEAFRNSGKRIIVGKPINTSIISDALGLLQFGTCKNEMLNAGTYIGYAKDIKKMITRILEMNDQENADDQVLLTKYCNLYPEDIHIDNQSFFLTVAACGGFKFPTSKDIQISKDGILYKDQKPFILHGPCKTNLYDVIKALGYDINEEKGRKVLLQNRADMIVIWGTLLIMFHMMIILFIFLRHRLMQP